MMANSYVRIAVVLGATLPVVSSARPTAQTPPAATLRVWTAEWKYDLEDPGRPYARHTKSSIGFHGVEEPRPDAPPHWTSRVWTWRYWDVYEQIGTLAYDPRVGRYPISIVKTCTGGGTVDLGPGDGSANAGAPTWQASCEEVVTPLDGSLPEEHRGPFPENVNQPPAFGPPQEGCSVSEAQRHVQGDSVGTSSYSLTVSPFIDADVEVDRAYETFVPEPGRPLTFTARSRSGPVQFRFELDREGTSHFPGYATNANIDDAFFVKYSLSDLLSTYDNDGPDVIFKPADFGESQWARRDLNLVETRTPDVAALVTITAMDYGAVGQLRAYVKAEDCGDWQPIRFKFAQNSNEMLVVPVDEDHNLIADAREEFRGLDPGADVDDEPRGNGFAGDGLTAFEEYRGFLVRGVGCGAEATSAVYHEVDPNNESQVMGWSDEHIRSSPRRKDLFVHTPDPELALVVPAVADASDLSVHVICEPHYDGNDSRIVNFTLKRAGLRSWHGKTVSQDEPQHGIDLEPVDYLALRGVAVPVVEDAMGPPRLTKTVQVRKPSPASSNAAHRARLEYPELVHTVVHEILHGVGVPHHADTVRDWRVVPGRQNVVTWLSLRQHAGGPPDYTLPDSLPEVAGSYYAAVDGRSYLTSLLVEPGGDCKEGADDALYYRDGKFMGCEASSIARRGQQNSGEFECPMRYSGSDYYEAANTVAQFHWTGLVSYRHRTWNRDLPGHLVDAWGGVLLRYRNDQDRDGSGRLCTRLDGSGINDPAGLDHNGSAARDKPCADYLVVNDLAARGLP